MPKLELKFEDANSNELIELKYDGHKLAVFDSILSTVRSAITVIGGEDKIFLDKSELLKPRHIERVNVATSQISAEVEEKPIEAKVPLGCGGTAFAVGDGMIGKLPEKEETSKETEVREEEPEPEEEERPKFKAPRPEIEENEWQEYVPTKVEEDWTGKMNKKQVCGTLGVHEGKLNNMMTTGQFPKPDGKFGAKVYWLRTTVVNHIDSRNKSSQAAKDVLKDFTF